MDATNGAKPTRTLAEWFAGVNTTLNVVEAPGAMVYSLGAIPQGDNPAETVRLLGDLWKKLGFELMPGNDSTKRAIDRMTTSCTTQLRMMMSNLYTVLLPALRAAVRAAKDDPDCPFVCGEDLPARFAVPLSMGGSYEGIKVPVVLMAYDQLPESHTLRRAIRRDECFIDHYSGKPTIVLGHAVSAELIMGRGPEPAFLPFYSVAEAARTTREWRAPQLQAEAATARKQAERLQEAQRIKDAVNERVNARVNEQRLAEVEKALAQLEREKARELDKETSAKLQGAIAALKGR
jgi:hypothetical protein